MTSVENALNSVWTTVTTSKRTINNYMLNDIVGKYVGEAEGVPCYVRTVRTYTDYRDLRNYIEYECINDGAEYVGRVIIELGRMTADGIAPVNSIKWIPKDFDGPVEFDTEAVSDFIEGIEVI